MTDATTAGSDARLLSHRPFLFYFLGRGFSRFAAQMATVALGWQVYQMTGSAFHLGLIGLVQFLPTAVLVFLAGHAADRFDRQRVLQVCQIIQACAAAYLFWGTLNGWMTVHGIYAAVALFGIAGAFESPATAALMTGVAPPGQFQRVAALSTGMFQLAVIAGPAIGGFAYAVNPAVPYGMMTVFWLIGSVMNGAIRLERPPGKRPAPRLSEFLAGIRFVRSDPAILATISLDLFAVLLGGATALLPIYASDILHTGPWGLGFLRAAPAIGALAMTVVLARRNLTRRVGMRMLQAVLVFGLATIVFALSRAMWLSLGALVVMGAADTISVVIRTSLVQLRTPDEMRGRVGAVNFLFVNASNQLGEFESGMTAALFGVVPAAAIGGIGTVLVAVLWMRLFPSLRRVERLE